MTEFDDFVRANYSGVLRTVALALGDADVAQDATQEAFAKAALRWDRVVRMERPVGWVCVVATNAGRRALRRRKVVSGGLTVSTVDHAEGVVDRLRFRDELLALPVRQRAAVVLRYLGDLSVAETAKALDVSPGTVKASTHAALEKLRVNLERGGTPCNPKN